jgi:hypothetical protein
MKVIPTNIGAEPKKLALLGAIVLGGAGLVYWTNSGNSVPPQAVSSPSSSGTTVSLNRMPNLPPDGSPPKSSSGGLPPRAPTRGGAGRVEDFRPSIKVPEGMDVSRIDPRLKTEYLARLRALPDEGGTRSVFEFYVPPPPPPPVQPIRPTQVTQVAPQPPTPPTPTQPPPPPPITIKLYALVGPPGSTRKVFFLDGEDTFMVGENDVIRNRYKIIHLGVLDAEVEDTVTKNRQTIKIVPEVDP